MSIEESSTPIVNQLSYSKLGNAVKKAVLIPVAKVSLAEGCWYHDGLDVDSKIKGCESLPVHAER